ncbi:MAG TPA: hypothetical protein VIW26_06795 [Gemmatimonadales bacterium]|jgi:hypothetical protein
MTLTLVTAPPEGPRDHIGNAAQMLVGAAAAVERLGLAEDATAELRQAIQGAQALCLRALFSLND